MSTNQVSRSLFRRNFKDNRIFIAIDRQNDVNFTWPRDNITVEGFSKRTYAAGTYSHLLFDIEYFVRPFKYAEVVITDRFTMDEARQIITFPTDSSKTGDENGVYYTVGKYSSVQGNFTNDSSSSGKRNWVHVIISAYDFSYGNVYIIFYDDAANKEQLMPPVVVDFTNVPTITKNVINKYNDTADNVFKSDWKDEDSARVDVLTKDESSSEYYNEQLNQNRLYTNGLGVAENGDTVAGHPLYVVKYNTFVPNSLSELYGTSDTSIGFTATEAFLAKADDKSSTTTDKLALTISENTSLNNTNDTMLTMIGDDNSKIIGHSQVFYASLSNANFLNASDKTLRDYTRVEADFVLTGISDDWA